MGSVHRRLGDDAWQGVETVAYGGDFEGIRKHELIGEREGAGSYTVRYFHVPAGARTARERHAHDHGVVIQRGRARVTLGSDLHEVGPGDAVYVEGEELHCFEAVGEEPLEFICVVGPRRRADDRADRVGRGDT